MASPDQILSLAQMRAAEQALVDAGTGVDELMQRAGHGAADWVWRMAAGRRVTVLTGPGNNGGDGYVLAEALRARGGVVAVVAAHEPRTDAARKAASLYRGEVLGREAAPPGEVLVDCLFGSGLTRGLSEDDLALLRALAHSHPHRVAVDLPSGVETDTGAVLSEGLPSYHLTLALGAWKPAHVLMPASAQMGELRLVEIGCGAVVRAGRMLRRPAGLRPPAADAHKYTRGHLGLLVGAMPGAALLAARAAQGAGAGYVRLIADRALGAPPDLVVSRDEALDDQRLSALLVGPGLGRDATALERLNRVLVLNRDNALPVVLDADALALLGPKLLTVRAGMVAQPRGPLVATPHEGELAKLEESFGVKPKGGKIERALALAERTGMVVVAKGPDTIIADPQGHWLGAPRASSWLSTSGTGDVLAGCIASRLAKGTPAFAASAQGVWLQGEAARLARGPFAAGELASRVAEAYAGVLA